MLLDHGANINLCTKIGTALVRAVRTNEKELVELLMSRGSNTRLGDVRGWTPLHHAADVGLPEIVQLLLQNGVDINSRSRTSETPLWRAAFLGDPPGGKAENFVSVGKLLLEKWADPNVFANEFLGGTALVQSIMRQDDSTFAELLIAHGADVNIPDSCGRTPFYLSAIYGHAGIWCKLAGFNQTTGKQAGHSKDSRLETPTGITAQEYKTSYIREEKITYIGERPAYNSNLKTSYIGESPNGSNVRREETAYIGEEKTTYIGEEANDHDKGKTDYIGEGKTVDNPSYKKEKEYPQGDRPSSDQTKPTSGRESNNLAAIFSPSSAKRSNDQILMEQGIIMERFLGTGKFGEVWKARMHGKLVAVKFLKGASHEDIEEVLEEASLLGSIKVTK